MEQGSRNASVQKRPRPRELGDEMELAKHPCTKSGVFRSRQVNNISFNIIKEIYLLSIN